MEQKLTKICSHCKQQKLLSDFYKNRSQKDGLDNNCKECKLKLGKKWREKNPEKVKKCHQNWRENNQEHVRKYNNEYAKKWHQENLEKSRKRRNEWQKNWYKNNPEKALDVRLKKDFNLSLEDYNKIFESQNGVCAICGLPETAKYKDKVKKLSIDHNHNTGKIRGLLCQKCNVAIGMLDVDDFNIEVLCSAISYMRQYED